MNINLTKKQEEEIYPIINNLSNYYDTDNILSDYQNNNFDIDNWEANIQDYYMPNIVIASVINGQMKQAKDQFLHYGINITDIKDNITDKQLEYLLS